MAGAEFSSRQSVVKSSTLGVAVVLVTLLFLMANYLGWKYHKRMDWTESELYTLSEKSRNILGQLDSEDRNLEAVVFMTPESELFSAVQEILSRYEAESQRFKVRVIDPQRNPAEAQRLVNQYDVVNLNSVVMDVGEDRRVIDEADMAEYDYSGLQYGQGAQMKEFKGEQLFSGAILELLDGRKPKILFTSGHGEAALDDFSATGLSQAKDLIGQDNFTMEEWASLGQPAVPEGTDLVVLAGPKTGLIEQELEVLSAFLDQGGRILLMLDPTLSETGLEDTGLSDWLGRYGVRLGEDIVVDPDNPLPFYSAETFFANSYVDHPVTQSLEEAGFPVIFSLARSVARGDSVEGVEVTELVQTTDAGWGETDLVNLSDVKKDDQDYPGPVSLGVAVALLDSSRDDPVEEQEEEPMAPMEAEGEVPADETAAEPADSMPAPPPEEASPGRLVVFGDSDFVTNLQLGNVGNPALTLNVVNWLVERDRLLGIPPKKAEQVRLNLTRQELSAIYWSVLLILPGLGVVLGLTVHVKRTRR